MAREIDLLIEAAQPNRAIVEKETNVLWSKDDLLQARALNEFDQPDDLIGRTDEACAVTGIYPGCLQQGAALADYSRYRLIGQTRHFLLFAQPVEAPVAAIPTGATGAVPAARR
jgi:hypothetical protein